MGELPKRLRKTLRELAARARERELRAALLPLAADFDAWRAGELNVYDLLDIIHTFHDGPNREIWKAYTYGSREALVASALADGFLSEQEVPDELLKHLEGLRRFHTETDVPSAEGTKEDPW